VGAVVRESGSGELACALINALSSVQTTNEASRDRLLEYFKLVARGGIDALNDKQCHLVDKNEKIYEFIAGQLRVLFFAGEPKSIIVCSHMFLKTTKRTPPNEVSKAARAKAQYQRDLARGQIEWKDEI
jgi:hypothetical protein